MVDIEEIFGLERVTIHLRWAQEIRQGLLVSYSISVLPVVGVTISMISNTRANLTLAYNTLYNVNVVADICGQRNSTTLINQNYGMCNIFRVYVNLCACNNNGSSEEHAQSR